MLASAPKVQFLAVHVEVRSMQGVRHVVDAARRNSSTHAALSARLARQCRMFLAVVAVKHTWTALTRVLLRRCCSEQKFALCEALLHAEAAQDVERTLVGACELDNHSQSQTCLQRACCAAITTPTVQLVPETHCKPHSFIESTNALPIRHPAPRNQHSPSVGLSQEAAIISAVAAAAALPSPMPPPASFQGLSAHPRSHGYPPQELLPLPPLLLLPPWLVRCSWPAAP